MGAEIKIQNLKWNGGILPGGVALIKVDGRASGSRRGFAGLGLAVYFGAGTLVGLDGGAGGEVEVGEVDSGALLKGQK
jgi:hypothetical protein